MRFSAGVQQEFVQLCPKHISNIDRHLTLMTDLLNYNHHWNVIAFYHIIVILKDINFIVRLRNL